MKSSIHAPYFLGYTRATMETTICRFFVKKNLILKCFLTSDCRLQLVYIKLESQVIAGQLYCSECVPDLYTHRPSRLGSWLYSKIYL